MGMFLFTPLLVFIKLINILYINILNHHYQRFLNLFKSNLWNLNLFFISIGNQNLKIMKTLIGTIALMLMVNFGMAQGSFGDIQGQIFESADSDTPAQFAKVWVDRGSSRFGADTDEEGRFTIHSVPSGLYVLNVNYFDDTLMEQLTVTVRTDDITRIKRINMNNKFTLIDGPDIYAINLLDHDFGQKRIDPLDIEKSPMKNDIKGLIAVNNSDIMVNDAGQMMIRGGRANDLVYFIDGVKMGEVQNVPSSGIGSVTIYTSAIPANYGDTTGGVIILETKSYYDLWRARKIRESAKNL